MLNNPKKIELSYLQLTAINHDSEMKKEKEFCIENNKLLRMISNKENIENIFIPNNISKEQFFVDCLLAECNFTSTFGATGVEYKCFEEESKVLADFLKIDIDAEQISQLHWATGVLPSSRLYFDRINSLDKKYGDMILDGLVRGFRYISYEEDRKYRFLSDISNYNKEDVIQKLKGYDSEWVKVSSVVDDVIGKTLSYGNGWCIFKNMKENEIIFGIKKFMHGSFGISITQDNSDFIVELTKKRTPYDQYGRQLQSSESTIKKVTTNKNNLLKTLLENKLLILNEI